jgi:hypothetical protein
MWLSPPCLDRIQHKLYDVLSNIMVLLHVHVAVIAMVMLRGFVFRLTKTQYSYSINHTIEVHIIHYDVPVFHQFYGQLKRTIPINA